MFAQYIFKTGVRVVIDNLLSRWNKNFSHHEFIPLIPTQQIFQEPKSKALKAWNHFYRFYWSQIELQWQAWRQKCDLVFATCMFSPYVQLIPTVTLIYDMALWRHPEWYPTWWLIANKLFTQYPTRYIRHITTISEHARQDIIRFFHLPPQRVSAIYLGLDLPEVSKEKDISILNTYGISAQSKYILYMGPALPHKNLPRLVEAFGLLMQRLPELSLFLVLGGPATNTHGPSDYNRIMHTAARYGIRDRLLFTGLVPREHCTVLYRNAHMYAFPSLFEGFGLPLIEAMASGVPVIASRCSALPEIGGDAVHYFDPEDLEDIAKAIYLVATQPDIRQTLIKRGLERSKMFSWDNAAAQYVQLFESLERISKFGQCTTK